MVRNEVLENLSEEDKKEICKIISDSQETANVAYSDSVTHAAKANFMWDELNKGLKFMTDYGWHVCFAKYVNWPFCILEKEGYFYTLMRKNRFYRIQRKSNTMHYSRFFAQKFNADVKNVLGEQGVLFSDQQLNQEYNLTEEENNKIQSMLQEILSRGRGLKQHAFILFDIKDGVLMSVEIVVLNSNLKIADFEKWDNLIGVETSHITEKVDQDNVFEPNKRVKLGVKSIAEKAAKEQQKVIANEDIDDSSDGI